MDSPSLSVIARLARNTTLIAVSRMTMAVTTMATMPILIDRLGIAGYGVWETSLAVTAFGAIWQGPLAGTLMWATSQAHATGDQEKLRRLFRLGMLVTAVLAIPLLTGAIAMRGFLPGFFHVPSAAQNEMAVIFPALVATTVVSGINECYAAAIDGCQKMGVTAMVRAAAYVGGTCVAVCCVLAGQGLYSVVPGQWAAALAAWALLRRIARTVCPSVTMGLEIPASADVRRLGAYAGLLFVGFLAASLRDQTDKLILAAFATPVWVGYYAVASRLTAVILELCKFVYGPTVTAAGLLSAQSDTRGLTGVYTTVMTWLPAALGVGVILVGGLQLPLVVLWMGRCIPEVTVLVFLLLLGNVSAVILTGPGTAICRGMGRVDLETRYVGLSLVCNLLLTCVLVATIGATGTVWASAVSWLIGSIYFAWLFPNRLCFPTAPAFKASATLLISSVFAMFLAWFVQVPPVVSSRWDAFLLIAWSAPPATALYVAVLFACRLLEWHAPSSARMVFSRSTAL